MDFSEKGVYCLIFENQDCKFEVGKKGEFSFASGFHIYVGSALGSGSLKRVKKHINFLGTKIEFPDGIQIISTQILLLSWFRQFMPLLLQDLNAHLPAG